MTSRRPLPLYSLCTLALLGAALVGCSPAPAPTPTPTPLFASEEEAFAAAEATYRAFIERVNAVDLGDPSTFEPLYELSSGEFQEADREAYSQMHAEGNVVSGSTVILSFTAKASKAPYSTVIASACLDVSAVEVVDARGTSVVSPDRPDVYALDLTFISDGADLRIDSANIREDSTCDIR